jgi:CRISPR-associated protein Csx3
MIQFKVEKEEKYVLVYFEMEGGIITPNHLKSLSPPDPITQNFAHLGVILSGRGPVWLYGFLVHYYHPTKWVATYDPRLQGAVVVESHTPEVQVGDIIPLENPTNATT